MSSDNVKVTKEEQIFLMEWFEASDPQSAIDNFVYIMSLEKVPSKDFLQYLKKVMKRMNF